VNLLSFQPKPAIRRIGSIMDAVTGVSYNERMVLPINPWKMHVARATAQTLTSNAFTTILFDTVLYDTSTAYSTGTGQFTVPVSGYYAINAIINVVMPAVAFQQVAFISLFVNGVERRRGHGETWVNGGAGFTISSMFGNSDHYNSGDLLTIQCWANSGGANPATPASGGEDYWTVHLISG
jgi:regulatory protein YycH of two-component signal transduction system YycFG